MRRFGSGSGNQQTPNPYDFAPGSQLQRKPVVVWVMDGDKVRRVRVQSGAIDATNAEIKRGLKEGDIVILSMTIPGKTGSTTTTATTQPTTSPFMPQRPAGRGR